MGDLRPALAAAATALRPGGWLVATVEHAADGAAAERGNVPDVTGRFLHDAEWIECELLRAGFDLVVVDELSIRDEMRRPVPGLVIVARTHTRLTRPSPTHLAGTIGREPLAIFLG